MAITEEILCLHFVLAAYLVFFLWTLKGDLGHRIYRARMHRVWRWFLMPTKHDRTEENWVRDQKLFAWISLPFVALVYVAFIISLNR
ncbi:MAG: hypothetical protein JXQ75_12550 [Phycisphaerae bacterium]|nr:hypothetical protein [Phycisphaerae bacterium]